MNIYTRFLAGRAPIIVLGGMCLATIIAHGASAGDWSYAQHGPAATARSDGSGTISGDIDELPGQSVVLPFEETGISDVYLYDTNADGTPDLITPSRGKITAFSGVDGSIIWSTPLIRGGTLVGVYDLDGDGTEGELVAVSGSTTGGLYVLDRDTGGLLWQFTEASNRGGVADYDIAVADIDSDGAAELFFAEWLYGNEYAYLADFSWGFSDVELVQISLPGDYRNYNPAVGGILLDTAEPGAFLVQQNTDMALFQICDAADAGAVCSATERVCLCTMDSFTDVHESFSAGPYRVQDIDNDGVDEVLDILANTRYGNAVYLLDVAEGYATGSAITADLLLWSRNYGMSSPESHIIAADQEMSDLDGDGDPDLVMSFYNNIDTEENYAGQVVDDGIYNPDGFSTGVFDANTGDLVLELPDTFAYGVEDLDGDGVPEIITSSTSGWTFYVGLTGYIVDCTSNCTGVAAWSDPSHTLVPDISIHDGADWPDASFDTLDVDGDGLPELLVFDGSWLDAVEVDVDTLAVRASVLLSDDEEIAAIEGDGPYVLLYDGTRPRLFDVSTSGVGPYLDIVGQAVGEVRAVQLDPNDPRASLVVNGSVFYSVAAPTSMADADLEMLPNLAFAEDLTGDGYPELVSWAQPDENEQGDLSIEVYSFDPTDPDGDGTPFGLLWDFSSATEPDLSGFEVTHTNGHAVRSLDWDDDGNLDVLFSTWSPTTWESSFLFLECATGALVELLPADFFTTNQRVSQYLPVWIEDLDNPSGDGTPDGIDDIILFDYRYMTIIPGGGSTATVQIYSDVYHSEGAIGDVDGDGSEDLISLLNGSTEPSIHAVDLSTSFTEIWPATDMVSIPSGGDESLALVDAGVNDGLDIAYVSGSGSLDVYVGDTGELADDFPVYLADGEMLAGYEDDTPAMLCVAVADIDGDGYEEALVGDYGGYLYAVNVDASDPDTPSVEWSLFFDAPVKDLGVADVDGDGAEEILVATQDSTVRVVDGLGASIEIQYPEDGECVGTPTITVFGTSTLVDLVDVYIAGVLHSENIDVSSDTWTSDAILAPGYGSWQIVAVGKDATGLELVYDQVVVMIDGDEDGDGWTLCGGDCDDTDASLNLDDVDEDDETTCDGDCDDEDDEVYTTADEVCDGKDNDCDGDVDEGFDADGDGYRTCDGDCDDDDPEIHPGAEDICGDGIDQDCSGTDKECDDYYGDGDDVGGGCDCALPSRSIQLPHPALGLIALMGGAMWIRRRRMS